MRSLSPLSCGGPRAEQSGRLMRKPAATLHEDCTLCASLYHDEVSVASPGALAIQLTFI